MAKHPGPYLPLNGGGDAPSRSPDDPPPYSELDGDNVTVPSPMPMPSSTMPYIHPDDEYNKSAMTNRARASVISPRPPPPPEDNHQSLPALPSVVTRGIPLASKPIDVVCPRCNTEIRTCIEKKPGLLAYLSGTVIACLCCFCGCCLIPCCIEQLMETKHKCPNCDHLIGKYRM